MTDTKYYLAMLRGSIMWLEKYIEAVNYYSDWKQRKQTDTSPILWVKENTPKGKLLHNVGTHLMLGFEGALDEEPLEFREEIKREFFKWLNTSKINADNAPIELKCALFDFNEILECRFEKARKDRDNRKREIEIDSPEYLEKMQKVFQISQEAIHSGKVNQMNDSKFEGNAEEGKKNFEAIANSLSTEEKENFHFWPQVSAEEKDKQDQPNQKPDNQVDPVLQSCRNNATSQITSALNESKLTSADLDFTNQKWENEINQTENIVKIMSIQEKVLTDIKKKKKTLCCQPASNRYHNCDYWNNYNCFMFYSSNLLSPKEN